MIYILKVMTLIPRSTRAELRIKESNKDKKLNANQFSLQLSHPQGCGLTFRGLSLPAFHKQWHLNKDQLLETPYI